jgi:hypothetical protein
MDEPASLPTRVNYGIKRIRNIIKQTVRLIPNISPSTVISQNQQVRVDLPIGTVDLSTFVMSYYAWTTPNGAPVGGATGYQQVRYLPRNSASLIENLEIQINGTSRVNIPNYNYVYNILHDYNQSGDGLSRRNIGENSDPSCKYYNQDVNIAGVATADYLCAKKGYPIGFDAATPAAALAVPFPNAPAGVSASLNDFDAYSVRSWLSFFDGSTKIIDTSIFGQITVIITFTKSAATMLGDANTAPIVAMPDLGTPAETGLVPLAGLGAAFADLAALNAATVATNDAVVAITTPAIVNDAGIDIEAGVALAALVPSAGNTFNIKNLNFTIVRYDMPPEFYQSQANVLESGEIYKIYFQNYSVFTGSPVLSTLKNSTMRVAISSKSVDYCIGTFRACNFDDNVDATNQVVISKLSDGYMGQFGNDAYTFENQVKSGKPILFNNSKYFVRNGESIATTQWFLGNTQLITRTPQDTYEELLRHFDISNDNCGGLYPGIKSIYHFNKTFYGDVLSLNVSGESSEIYNVSGKDSDELPLQIGWNTTSTTAFPADAVINVAATNCLPVMIVATSPHLQISRGRQISYIP